MSDETENTGQISVAELLARNGQQVESRGGRRRRGNAGGISVAELTGEFPAVSDGGTPPVRNRRAAPDPDEDSTPDAPAAPKAEAPSPKAETPAAPKAEPAPKADTAPKSEAAPKAEAAPTAEAAAAPEHTQAIPALRRAVFAKADADRKAAAERAADASKKPTGPAPAAPTTSAAAPAAPTPAAPTPAAPVTPAEKTEVVAKPAAVPFPRKVEPKAGRQGPQAESKANAGEPAKAEPPATQPSPQAKPAASTKAASQTAASQTAASTKAQPVGSKPTPAATKPAYTGTPDVREPALLSGSSLEADLMRQARNARTESLEEARAQVHTTGEFPRVVDTAAPGDVAPGDAASGTKAAGDTEAAEDTAKDGADAPAKSAVRQWAVLAGQAVVAVVAGALLFKGFEKLWDGLPWVALVLAVLVIAGLVAVVRILRQTEDLLSLLIAVIVGVFVTIGPLVFVLGSS